MPDPVAASPDGTTIAIADGPELLVYDRDGAPKWKAFVDAGVRAVAVGPEQVCGLTTDGHILRWTLWGQPADPLEAPGATAIAATEDGLIAAATPKGVALFDAQGRRGAAVGATTAIAAGAERTLGVCTGAPVPVAPPPVPDGAPPPPPPPPGATGFAVLHAGGAVLGAVPIRGRPTGVANVGGTAWVIGHDRSLSVFSATGDALLHHWPLPAPAGAVAGMPDGVGCAVALGQDVHVYEAHSYQRAGLIHVSRPIQDLVFLPGGRLVIALDDGDLTFFDLYDRQFSRSEPHTGRGRNNWGVKHDLDAGVVRGAQARARAGRVAIARYVGPRDDPEYDRRWWQACGMVAGGTVLFTLLCAGCAGFGWIGHLKGWLPF